VRKAEGLEQMMGSTTPRVPFRKVTVTEKMGMEHQLPFKSDPRFLGVQWSRDMYVGENEGTVRLRTLIG